MFYDILHICYPKCYIPNVTFCSEKRVILHYALFNSCDFVHSMCFYSYLTYVNVKCFIDTQLKGSLINACNVISQTRL